ncbi:MAG: hypothetical protein PUD36_05880 [Bacteroidales bacterium]|nr:hypothetical protein [Bacteroidales bacterium]
MNNKDNPNQIPTKLQWFRGRMGLHLLNHSNEDNTILKSSNYKKSIHNTRHHIPNKKLEYRKNGRGNNENGGMSKGADKYWKSRR